MIPNSIDNKNYCSKSIFLLAAGEAFFAFSLIFFTNKVQLLSSILILLSFSCIFRGLICYQKTFKDLAKYAYLSPWKNYISKRNEHLVVCFLLIIGCCSVVLNSQSPPNSWICATGTIFFITYSIMLSLKDDSEQQKNEPPQTP